MGVAAKVIDWNGRDVPAGVGELLAELPPGRYQLAVVPVDEPGEGFVDRVRADGSPSFHADRTR